MVFNMADRNGVNLQINYLTTVFTVAHTLGGRLGLMKRNDLFGRDRKKAVQKLYETIEGEVAIDRGDKPVIKEVVPCLEQVHAADHCNNFITKEKYSEQLMRPLRKSSEPKEMLPQEIFRLVTSVGGSDDDWLSFVNDSLPHYGRQMIEAVYQQYVQHKISQSISKLRLQKHDPKINTVVAHPKVARRKKEDKKKKLQIISTVKDTNDAVSICFSGEEDTKLCKKPTSLQKLKSIERKEEKFQQISVLPIITEGPTEVTNHIPYFNKSMVEIGHQLYVPSRLSQEISDLMPVVADDELKTVTVTQSASEGESEERKRVQQCLESQLGLNCCDVYSLPDEAVRMVEESRQIKNIADAVSIHFSEEEAEVEEDEEEMEIPKRIPKSIKSRLQPIRNFIVLVDENESEREQDEMTHISKQTETQVSSWLNVVNNNDEGVSIEFSDDDEMPIQQTPQRLPISKERKVIPHRKLYKLATIIGGRDKSWLSFVAEHLPYFDRQKVEAVYEQYKKLHGDYSKITRHKESTNLIRSFRPSSFT